MKRSRSRIDSVHTLSLSSYLRGSKEYFNYEAETQIWKPLDMLIRFFLFLKDLPRRSYTILRRDPVRSPVSLSVGGNARKYKASCIISSFLFVIIIITRENGAGSFL